MSLAKAIQLSLQGKTLNGKTLQLSFHGILNKILDEILTIKINDLEEVIVSFHKDKLEELKDLNEIDCSGIYFLWAKNRNLVYIGQASNKKLIQRLNNHSDKKDWWNRCIFVTTKDNHFDAADLDYLEYTFIDKAKEAGIVLDNGDEGIRSGNISEQKKEPLNVFIENIMSILENLEVIGINIFKDKSKVSIREKENPHRNCWSKEISKEKFFLTRNECDGTIIWQKAEEFVLKKDSKLAPFYQYDLECRDRLEYETRKYGKEGSIEKGIVKKDITFETLNSAASFCCRASINAWTALKNDEGKSIDEVCKRIYETAKTED